MKVPQTLLDQLADYPKDCWVDVSWTTELNDWVPVHQEKVKVEAVKDLILHDLLPTGTIKGIKVKLWEN